MKPPARLFLLGRSATVEGTIVLRVGDRSLAADCERRSAIVNVAVAVVVLVILSRRIN